MYKVKRGERKEEIAPLPTVGRNDGLFGDCTARLRRAQFSLKNIVIASEVEQTK